MKKYPNDKDKLLKMVIKLEFELVELRAGFKWFKKFFDAVNDDNPDYTGDIIDKIEHRKDK